MPNAMIFPNPVAHSSSCRKPAVSVVIVRVARIPPIESITAATWMCLCVSTPITTCPERTVSISVMCAVSFTG